MEALHFYILLLGLAWIIFNRYFIPRIKNLPPTPLSALTVLGYLIFFKQPIHRTLSKIATRHGPILLLGFGIRRVLVISSASAAEDLFTKNDDVFANRPKMVAGRTFGHDYTKLAWAPYGDLWLRLRRVSLLEVLPFHRQPDQHHDLLADEAKLLLRQLFDTQEETVELKPKLQDFVCNVMTRMFAGKRYCHKKETEEGDEKETISLLDYATNSFRMTTAETDFEYFMPILKCLPLIDLEQRCNELQSKGDSCIDTIIEDIRNRMSNDQFYNGSCQKEDSVIRCLLDKQKDEPKLYSDEVIRGLVLELLSAGTDTSAGTIEWALSLLLNHPEIMKKAQNEIAKVAGDRILEPSDIENLPYLRCIVKETMRLYPVAPLLVPHESSKECKVGGYNVPRNTMLLVNVWAIQNDPNIWEEPTEFKPERFMEILDERDGFKLMPFGFGRRSCPGKHMAVRVIAFVLGSLIHCYNWETVDKKMVDMTEQIGFSLLKDKPLMAKCRPRLTIYGESTS